MTAKQQAIQDMMPELEKRNKRFIAFRKELNPIMRKLMSQQIKQQMDLQPFSIPTKANSQLIARCFFAKGEVCYDNYGKYYKKEK